MTEEANQNIEGQTEEGQVEEGQTEEGQVEEGQVEEGQVEEGQVEEGQVEEGQTQTTPKKKIEIDEDTLAEREKRIRLETELEVLKRQPTTQQPDHAKQEAERQEKERLSLMTPEEQQTYKLSKQVSEMQNEIRHTKLLAQFNQADSADRSAFVAKASDTKNPHAALYGKHMAAVEQKLNDYRRQGVYPTRDEVLRIVIGDAMLNSKPNLKARQAAKNRVTSTQGKPTTVSNSSGPSSKKPASECTLAELAQRINASKR